MIIKLIKYVYYRISHVYDRKETPVNLWDYEHFKDQHDVTGAAITAALLLFNIDTILLMLENHYIIYSDTTSLFRSKWFSIGFLLLVSWILLRKKSYDQLNEKYKNEKYRVFKGFLVVLYIVLTIVIYILTRVLNL